MAEIQSVELFLFVARFISPDSGFNHGIFLTELFGSMESCMDYLNTWAYDPARMQLECNTHTINTPVR